MLPQGSLTVLKYSAFKQDMLKYAWYLNTSKAIEVGLKIVLLHQNVQLCIKASLTTPGTSTQATLSILPQGSSTISKYSALHEDMLNDT